MPEGMNRFVKETRPVVTGELADNHQLSQSKISYLFVLCCSLDISQAHLPAGRSHKKTRKLNSRALQRLGRKNGGGLASA